jgi:uncharacterized protein YfiM (DUF2279 family)
VVEPATPAPDQLRGRIAYWLGPGLFGAWLLVMCFVPDPRPLGAREWAVAAVRACSGIGEPAARVVATVALRAMGFALLGALLMVAMEAKRWDKRGIAVVALAPVLAIVVLWISLGYRPIALQIEIAAISALTGAIARLALHKSPLTAVGLLVGVGGLFAWGAATGISDELHTAARAAGRHVLASPGEIPDGDAGFARALELAFAFAEANSDGADPVLANRAAILALSVILGEEQVAAVASRDIDSSFLPQARELRKRITLYGRKDWPQHFWVSAGLTALADSDRSIAVGLTKELMDATPGGSGFSFADLTADAAGNLFTLAATRDAESARATQARIRAGVKIADFCPDVRDLPEGLTQEQFQERFGGLGGDETQRVVDDIRRRLAECAGLK